MGRVSLPSPYLLSILLNGLTHQNGGNEAHGPSRVKDTDTSGGHLMNRGRILVMTHMHVTHPTSEWVSHI